jgi:hypothetical protein
LKELSCIRKKKTSVLVKKSFSSVHGVIVDPDLIIFRPSKDLPDLVFFIKVSFLDPGYYICDLRLLDFKIKIIISWEQDIILCPLPKIKM